MPEPADSHPYEPAWSQFALAALSPAQRAALEAAFREDPDLERELSVGMEALTSAAARREFIDCFVGRLDSSRRPASAVLPALKDYALRGRQGGKPGLAAPTGVEAHERS